jgi:hypothetical protein
MISICHSKSSMQGEHKLEWKSTFDGGGYWVCLNPECGAIETEGTGHHGG